MVNVEPGASIEQQSCSLPQLSLIINMDYVTVLTNKKRMFPGLPRRQYISCSEIESYLLRSKENQFRFTFENNHEETFFHRMLQVVDYDLLSEKREWLEPKDLKFLLDLIPWDLQKLRKEKKLEYRKEYLPYRKSTSKNDFIFVYKRESVIDYIIEFYGKERLHKRYTDLVIEPQFISVTKLLEYLAGRGITISQAKAYRMIERSEIPANRFNESLRIPIKELNIWLSQR